MFRSTVTVRHLMPRNAGVAPKFDTWSDKYDAWRHMRRMGKLVGTGFYIAPNWYHHFRMFPPHTHHFKEEKTMNPHAVEEPTQEQFDSVTADRRALRDELARRSRTLASAGMRYFNIFWVKKPLDDAERRYHSLRRSTGLGHDDALKQVLAEFYQKQALRRRSHMIQAEEAQMTGKFLTMREAMSVVQLLSDAQKLSLAPHQFAEIAQSTRARAASGETATASVQAQQDAAARRKKGAGNLSPEQLHAMLAGSDDAGAAGAESEEGKAGSGSGVVVEDAESDSAVSLKNLATGSTGDAGWLDSAEGAHAPTVPLN